MSETFAGQRWAPDVALAVVVAIVGMVEATTVQVDPDQSIWLVFLVAWGIALAVGLSRHQPGAALALVWATCGIQVLGGTAILLVEFAVAFVAFGTARWGSTATVWLSALSIPVATVIAIYFVNARGVYSLIDLVSNQLAFEAAYQLGDTWLVGASVLGMFVLGAPWLAGLALRFMARAQESQISQVAAEEDAARAHHESEQAREIARLREEQAGLARDVHDVVGHSLAVILAQAESAQYLDDLDTDALKKTMATIATSARTSLQDVRTVLTATQQPPAARARGLDQLVEGVRASGHEVRSTEIGTPQPLPPELEVVAYRVQQEMLTNAIRHGRRDQPVEVERHWEGELRIEVRNVVGGGEDDTDPEITRPMTTTGQGLDGMRRRLEAVGGRLDVRLREEAVGTTFTVTAWVPVRTSA